MSNQQGEPLTPAEAPGPDTPTPAVTDSEAEAADGDLTQGAPAPQPSAPGPEVGAAPPPPARPALPPPVRAVPVTPTPKKANGKRGCLVAALLFAGILAVAAGVFVYAVAQDILSAAPQMSNPKPGRIREEVLFDDATGNKKIAVIDVKGVIMQAGAFDQASAPRILEEIKAAHEDDDVAGVILDMNTPGGEVTASDEIHHALQKLRRKGKIVVTCMRSVGASGGYYVAAGTDYILANRLTLTGSIGVIIGTVNYAALFEKIGLQTETYKSGALKDMLSGGRERTEAEKAYVQDLVDSTFMEFAAIVAGGREAYGHADDVRDSPFGDGRVLTGKQALELGLVDDLGFFEDAVAKARELTGEPDAKIVRLRKSVGLLDLLMSVESKSGGAVGSLLPAEWRCLQPGRLYYLMPTAMP